MLNELESIDLFLHHNLYTQANIHKKQHPFRNNNNNNKKKKEKLIILLTKILQQQIVLIVIIIAHKPTINFEKKKKYVA